MTPYANAETTMTTKNQLWIISLAVCASGICAAAWPLPDTRLERVEKRAF